MRNIKTHIKPEVRSDGVTFVDQDHFIDGSPIMEWKCDNKECQFKTDHQRWNDEAEKAGDTTSARSQVTLGFYGPNGNGFNYWCPKCDYRMSPLHNPYNALDKFFGFRTS